MKLSVGIIGATGMVGQRLVGLLANHPFLSVGAVAASAASAGKKYGEIVPNAANLGQAALMTVLDGSLHIRQIADSVDFVFCAVDLPTDATIMLEEAYARAECPVVSTSSAHRLCPDVPMVIPELNAHHLDVIKFQQKRLNTKRGFVAAKCNCVVHSFVPPLFVLKDFGVERIAVCTYQAVSGAGKTLDTFAQIADNVIPFINGEELKSAQEPLKIWGSLRDGQIISAPRPAITAQCVRVPLSDGHLAAVFASFKHRVDEKSIKRLWSEFKGTPQQLGLHSAPKQYIHYHEQQDYPQPALHRDLEGGMAISTGRLRVDSPFDIRFVGLSHNTIRGAAGGAILLAELLCAKNYIGGK